MTLSAFARPKVNLTLKIEGKRADGYHLLRSLVCFTSGGDHLTVSVATDLTLDITGPFAGDLDSGADNLILQAARLLQRASGKSLGARITLEKNLPVASGIGGGSADAAAALQLLCRLWDLDLSAQELANIGLSLGADVPACLRGVPLIMSGIGEELTPLTHFPNLHILLVNPGVAVSTPAVFRALNWQGANVPAPADRCDTITLQDIHAGTNDLQSPALILVPEIAAVLTLLAASEGAILARMSGSGATCFALFDTEAALQHAAQMLKTDQPHWWVYPAGVDAVGEG
jgi:4-diphosphocytidyl-2-C-methyl-D-erythritol kinase